MARYALILAAACGFMISAVSGLFIVPFLHKLHFGQTIKEIGPTWHNKKQGTPTMGGLCFILGTVFAVCLALISLMHGSPELLGGVDSASLYLAIFSAFGFGFIGFLDDFIKVLKKRNLGLRAWQKIVGQLLVTTALLVGLSLNGTLSTCITVPFFGMVDFGLAFYPLSYILIIGMVNAVNLTDGIDGLCSCVTFVGMLGFLTLISFLGQFVLSILPAALAGADCGKILEAVRHDKKMVTVPCGVLPIGCTQEIHLAVTVIVACVIMPFVKRVSVCTTYLLIYTPCTVVEPHIR